MTRKGPGEGELARFVYREARLIDEKRLDEWYELFTEDALYWMPLVRGQTDPHSHTSLFCEDRFLLKVRIERLKNPLSHSQQQPSFCQHVLQRPEVVERDDNAGEYVLRTPFVYLESAAGRAVRARRRGAPRSSPRGWGSEDRGQAHRIAEPRRGAAVHTAFPVSVAAPGTVARVLEDAAARHGDKPFLRITRDTAERTGIEAGDLSYAEAWDRTQALIGDFSGIAGGGPQRVALLLENRPEMFLHWLALNALGISAAPLNPAWRSAELGYALAHSESRLVIALPARVAGLRDVVRQGRAGCAGMRARRGHSATTIAIRCRPGSPRMPPIWNARSSIPRGPPAGPRAACSATAISR